jgi:hypothetical protein
MIAVFSESKSPRLQFILTFLCKRILGIDFKLITDWEKFLKIDVPRVNYSGISHGESLQIVPSGLLSERYISPQKIKVRKWKGLPIFFLTGKKKEIPFDMLAASFYLVSRYEEYLDYHPDKHGRFPAAESLAYKEGFLEKPVINHWALILAGLLKQRYPDYTFFRQGGFEYLSTIDIDMAFCYRHKGFLRNLGGGARELMQLNFKSLGKRMAVLSGKERDPFDNFDYQEEVHDRFSVHPVYFVLLGDRGKYDKNIPFSNEAFTALIQRLVSRYKVGIHPSYGSSKARKRVRQEIRRLEDIVLHPVECSRQHFLKLDIRQTYALLQKNGIKEDHSMGYSEVPGFRAGTCTPFPFYDLQKNETRDIVLYPFAVMDVALNRFLGLNPEEAIQRIKTLMDEVRSVNGLFISVFHNESLSDFAAWEGWRNVYEKMLSFAEADDTALQARGD